MNYTNRKIISVDMDAYFAAVEVRDDPTLKGKPLIIGALPHERGVVSTCSYEARVFGVRSAMSIKEAYRRCPHGIYMHPNPRKYREVSEQIHEIWISYTDVVEFISLDEGFLDVTGSERLFGGAVKIALEIKERTFRETGLTCSVGVGYSIMSAKLASEEKKPDGFYEIATPEALRALIYGRDVRIIYGVGAKTAETLYKAGIHTVRDVLARPDAVVRLTGNHGREILRLAQGVDERRVTPYYEEAAKSLGCEQTFQRDTEDFGYLKDVLRLIAKKLSLKIRLEGIFVKTVTLKVKYGDMKLVTRAKSGAAISGANDIYNIAAALLDTLEKRPVRLVGISLSGFTDERDTQLTLDDLTDSAKTRAETLDKTLLGLHRKYGGDVIRTGGEIAAQIRLGNEENGSE